MASKRQTKKIEHGRTNNASRFCWLLKATQRHGIARCVHRNECATVLSSSVLPLVSYYFCLVVTEPMQIHVHFVQKDFHTKEHEMLLFHAGMATNLTKPCKESLSRSAIPTRVPILWRVTRRASIPQKFLAVVVKSGPRGHTKCAIRGMPCGRRLSRVWCGSISGARRECCSLISVTSAAWC